MSAVRQGDDSSLQLSLSLSPLPPLFSPGPANAYRGRISTPGLPLSLSMEKKIDFLDPLAK